MTCVQPDRNVTVHINQKYDSIAVSLADIEKLTENICSRFTSERLQNTKYEISIAIIDDDEFRRLNRKFLNNNITSDCLSFDLSDDTEAETQKVFDIIINGEMVKQQADLRGHSEQAELALYITHGLLHNFGFDDSGPDNAGRMHDFEDKILKELGYGAVYNKDIKKQ